MSEKQMEMDKGLLAVGNMESSSDENTTELLSLAANRLEQTSGRNFDWQFNHKHRTRAWRDEVFLLLFEQFE